MRRFAMELHSPSRLWKAGAWTVEVRSPTLFSWKPPPETEAEPPVNTKMKNQHFSAKKKKKDSSLKENELAAT